MSDIKQYNQKVRYKDYILKLNNSKKKIKIKKGKLNHNKKGAYWASTNQRKAQNKYEKIVIELLKSLGVTYSWQHPFYNETRFISVDFYLPKRNIVLEIDGKQHNTKEAIEKDKIRTKYIKEVHGVSKVVRIANNDVMNNYDKVYKKLTKLLK